MVELPQKLSEEQRQALLRLQEKSAGGSIGFTFTRERETVWYKHVSPTMDGEDANMLPYRIFEELAGLGLIEVGETKFFLKGYGTRKPR